MLSLIQKTIMPTIAMIWASAYFFEVLQLSEKNRHLIKPVFLVMLVLYIINTFTDYLDWKKSKTINKQNETKAKNIIKNKNDLITVGLIVLICVIYIGIMKYVGFTISTLLFLVSELIVLKTKNNLMLIGLPIALTAILFIAFTQLLSIPLPRGFIGF